MFCVSCKYDLRGQVEQRCPECGRPFLFNDARSYLSTLSAARFRLSAAGKTAILSFLRIFFLTMIVGSHLAVPSIIMCGSHVNGVITYKNVVAIMVEWKRQCGGTIDCPFDKSLAMQNMSVRLSPIGDQKELDAKRKWERDLRERPIWFFLPCLFALLFGLTFKGKTRRFLLLADLIVFLFVAGASAGAKRLADLRYRGSYAFLDDFEYLGPPFAPFTDRDGTHVMIAFGPSPDSRNHVLVATLSGRFTGAERDEFNRQLELVKPIAP